LLRVHKLKHINESLAESPRIKKEKDVQIHAEENIEENELLRNDRALALSIGESFSVLAVEKEEATIALASLNKICPQCKKVFDTDEALYLHIDEHGAFHAGSSKPYKCNYCYKSFTRRFRLEAHKSVHGNEADKPFRCNLCLRKFLSNSALTAHIRFHIEGCKGYDCPICREGFFSMAGLKAHVKTHCVNGEYICPSCKKVFSSYSKIRRHIRSYHSLMPHVCSICSKEMPSVDKLKIHMLSHSDRRDFLCPECGKRFKRKDKLKEHSKRMHSGERQLRVIRASTKGTPKFVPKVDPADYKRFIYKCTTCLLGFKRRGMLVNHLAKRHPNVDMKCVPELNQPILKANQTFKCQYCDKRYRSSSKRKLHILKYHPGAELPPKAKASSDNDNSEGSTFTSSNPHPCNWCYRQYASRGRLLRHQRHHHPTHSHHNDDGAESSGNNMAFLEAPSSMTGELSLNGQLVDVNILRNQRLANIVRASSGSPEEDNGNEEDLLTQAMGEITPLAAARPLLVSGGQQGATLALVASEGPDGVTLSLPNGQLISLIPGLSVTTGPSSVSSSSRTHISRNSPSIDGAIDRNTAGPSMPAAYTLGQSSNAAEAVQLATPQPSSPSSQVVWSM
ncbi:PR domain zinc finger protein 10, partial [Halocaridina rubra]